jgi:hypothetical protein
LGSQQKEIDNRGEYYITYSQNVSHMKTKQIVVASLCILATMTALPQALLAQSPPPPSVFTPPVLVMGNNPKWTRITGVQADTLIRVFADGAVKFGPRSSTDTAVAGVEGNGFFRWLQGTFSGQWEKVVTTPSAYAGMIKNAFGRSEPVNFDQGGVWIKIVDHTTGEAIAAPNLYYDWNSALNVTGFSSDRDVYVYAKAHDGGRNAESTDSYNDNTGYYRVWVGLAKPERVEWTIP